MVYCSGTSARPEAAAISTRRLYTIRAQCASLAASSNSTINFRSPCRTSNVVLHSNCFSLSGWRSQLLLRTSPLSSSLPAYRSTMVASATMDLFMASGSAALANAPSSTKFAGSMPKSRNSLRPSSGLSREYEERYYWKRLIMTHWQYLHPSLRCRETR